MIRFAVHSSVVEDDYSIWCEGDGQMGVSNFVKMLGPRFLFAMELYGIHRKVLGLQKCAQALEKAAKESEQHKNVKTSPLDAWEERAHIASLAGIFHLRSREVDEKLHTCCDKMLGYIPHDLSVFRDLEEQEDFVTMRQSFFE